MYTETWPDRKIETILNRISRSLDKNVKIYFGLSGDKSEAHLMSFEQTLFQTEKKIRAIETWTKICFWRAPNLGKHSFGIRKAQTLSYY